MEGNYNRPRKLILDGEAANWQKFKQQFDLYLKAAGLNEKDSETKVAILLNLAGEEAIDVFNTFTLTATEKADYNKVVEAFEKHCQPKKNVIYDSYKFFSRNQKNDENFDHYVTDLRLLAKPCEFGNQEERLIRDKIVLGIVDKSLQERLLRVTDLTLDKAIHYCRAAETGKIQMSILAQDKVTEVAAINKDKRKTDSTTLNPKCGRCNKSHRYGQCPAYNKLCSKCKKPNHFAIVCRQGQKPFNSKRQVHELETNIEKESDEEQDFYFASPIVVDTCQVNKINSDWIHKIKIQNEVIDFKIDSGADINVLPERIFRKVCPNQKINKFNAKLLAYGGVPLKTLGIATIKCTPENRQEIDMQFVIVAVKSEAILGREAALQLNLIKRIHSSIHNNATTERDKFLKKYQIVFEGLGKLPFKYEIRLKEDAVPVVKPMRRLPEVIKKKLGPALQTLEKQGIIEKVITPTDWVNDLTVVEKKNGTIRVCLNPSELNKNVKREHYTIPTVEELTANLAGRKIFSVLDMKDGFHQIQLTEESSLLCTFNTPFGRFKFNRLPFGLASSPEVFQRENSRLFGDIPGVQVYFDDIIVAGKDESDHDAILEEVMNRAIKYNVKFNVQKIQYKVNKVLYVGLEFSENGVSPDAKRVTAIQAIPPPSNKRELQKFLGMVTFLHKFIPNLSEIATPLRNLLKNKSIWHWQEENAFNLIKSLICKAPTLKYFDAKSKILIQTDASNEGLGCCLMQQNQPVAYASRTLTVAERNYPIIEKELLGIVYACERFHQFIYGHCIDVITDHKPLVNIINKPLHKSTNRIQRLRLKLMKYSLNVMYQPGENLHIADLLSRVPVQTSQCEDPDMADIVHSISVNEYLGPRSFLDKLKAETRMDPVLSRVLENTDRGWEKFSLATCQNPLLKQYFKLRASLYNNEGILIFDDKIVIPKSLRDHILKLAHGKAHLGMVKTKQRIRQTFYWPNINFDVEEFIKRCTLCEIYQRSSTHEPLRPHEIPKLPFEKIGLDIADHNSNSYLIAVDYLSKWLDIIPLGSKSCKEIILKLKILFANFGVPKEVVSDNVPFNSNEFTNFATHYNFRCVYSSPRYPRSNGLAEKGVGIAKQILKKCTSFEEVSEALLEYRTTPVAGTPFTPSQILLSRQLRNQIPLNDRQLQPNVVCAQARQALLSISAKTKQYHDRHCQSKEQFAKGDSVVYQDTINKRWRQGVIADTGFAPRSYKIITERGNIICRNSYHIKKSWNSLKSSTDDNYDCDDLDDNNTSSINHTIDPTSPSTSVNNVPSCNRDTAGSSKGLDNSAQPPTSTSVSRFGRVRRPPSYLKSYVTKP